ncbi:MAG: hypothetical protein E6Q97_31330 [Desulfurellales bacterium]|nr:MAG: hypothetical protein E6Q97_31330 [Desulfurellales bacterium]
MVAKKSDATARLVEKGIQPRGLPVEEAAAYVGLGAVEFEREVERGRFPQPMPLSGRRKVWDRKALDAALDGHTEPRESGSDPIMALIDAGK